MPLRKTGNLYRMAKIVNPDYKVKNAGETAIMMWLTEEVEKTDREIMVIYENGKVPELIRRNATDIPYSVLTTRSFLDFAQKQGLIGNADDVWSLVKEHAPTVSETRNIMTNKIDPSIGPR